ncbi:MAG: hypothetical protein GTO18_20865 [Anaerolineales bacterium]|nr:hypothetical protein [Anaerolineales bacterium]
MTDILGIDLIGTLLAMALTVMVLSYIFGDNPLFRLAMYIFIGVAAGYAGSIAWYSILKPNLLDPILSAGFQGLISGELFADGQGVMIIGAWILIVMLLLKVSPSTARWGILPMILMVAVGAGVVVGGSISGTLIPQARLAMASLNPSVISVQTGETGLERVLNIFIILVGTICTLLYFRFAASQSPTGRGERSSYMSVVATLGRIFIAITFGTMFAGALASTLFVLTERMSFLVNFFTDILSFL